MRTCKARPMHWGSSIDLLHSRNAQGQDGGELLTDADLAPVKEPAKAWRNWFLYPTGQRFSDGSIALPGQPKAGPNIWPSAEIAEQKAHESIAEWEVNASRYWITSERIYLGALPEGERP